MLVSSTTVVNAATQQTATMQTLHSSFTTALRSSRMISLTSNFDDSLTAFNHQHQAQSLTISFDDADSSAAVCKVLLFSGSLSFRLKPFRASTLHSPLQLLQSSAFGPPLFQQVFLRVLQSSMSKQQNPQQSSPDTVVTFD